MKKVIHIENLEIDQLKVILTQTMDKCFERQRNFQDSLKIKNDEKLTTKEVSALLKKTPTTIYSYCKKRLIPYEKVSNRLYFDKNEVLDSMRKFKQKDFKYNQLNF